jgi:hypothetical protein
LFLHEQNNGTSFCGSLLTSAISAKQSLAFHYRNGFSKIAAATTMKMKQTSANITKKEPFYRSF